MLFTLTPGGAGQQSGVVLLDASETRSAQEKARLLREQPLLRTTNDALLASADAIVSFESTGEGVRTLVGEYAKSGTGMQTFDLPRFVFRFWEVPELQDVWRYSQSTVETTRHFGGCEDIVRWEGGTGSLYAQMEALKAQGYTSGIWRAGSQFWGRKGVVVSLMGDLPCSVYLGYPFNQNTGVLMPNSQDDLPALWAFGESGELSKAVRAVDQSLKVTNGTVAKVPFDLRRWREVAAVKYPSGLPQPESDDISQWLFHGYPQSANDPLQVAVARLCGYRWPAETDTGLELAERARIWIAHCDKLAPHSDDDGIVCLPSVRGEAPAHDRLLKLVIAAWETVQAGSWKPTVLDKLLGDADCGGKGLDVWLRDKFFEQHAKRFHHRPFIWHVWDGLKDGFSALVNYHKLDAKKLERLIHTYLGDWIRQQEAGVRDRIDGASQRLAAARELKRRLELIQVGEPPYDIFVRWKSLAEQPVGWNPDLNDGVRLNIRPFMVAEVLRHNKKPKLNVTWDKDRGKDVESAPWFNVFKGDRINDHHLTLGEKQAARSIAGRS